MKSLIEKMDQLSQVAEAKKGLPPWLKKDDDKKSEKADKDDDDDDKEKVEEAKKGLPPWLKKDKDGKVKKSDDKDDKKKDDKEKVEEAISVQADGEEAMSLLNLLKLSGQAPLDQGDASGPIGHPMDMPAEEPMDAPMDAPMSVPPSADGEQDSQEFTVDETDRDPSYANTPDEEIASLDAATPSGNDLNKSKHMTKHGYQQGDNPLSMEDVAKMEGKLAKMFESLSKKKIK